MLKKREVLNLKVIFEDLKKYLPFECARNLGLLNSELKSIEVELKNLNESYSNGDKLYMYETTVDGGLNPVFERKKGIERKDFDSWDQAKKDEYFTKFKGGITFKPFIPEKFEDYKKTFEAIHDAEINTDVRKIKIGDTDLKRVADTIANDLVKDEALKNRLGIYIEMLDEYGYTEIKK